MTKRTEERGGARRSRWVLQNGPAIREFRELTRWTGTALASEIGVHQSTLTNYEREHRSAAPEVLDRIADALGVDVEAIRREKAVIRTGRASDAMAEVAA